MNTTTLRKLLARTAPAAVLLIAPFFASAGILRLVPSTSTVGVGDIFTLDLLATDLQLGGYDVTFGYNPLAAFLDEQQVAFDTHLGGPANSLQFVFAGLDTLEVGEVSFLTSASDLAALQAGQSYALAHIQVKALLPGTLIFDFIPTPFTVASDYLGTAIDGVVYQGASVTVIGAAEPPPSSVPEPDSWILLLTGAGLLAVPRVGRFLRTTVAFPKRATATRHAA